MPIWVWLIYGFNVDILFLQFLGKNGCKISDKQLAKLNGNVSNTSHYCTVQKQFWWLCSRHWYLNIYLLNLIFFLNASLVIHSFNVFLKVYKFETDYRLLTIIFFIEVFRLSATFLLFPRKNMYCKRKLFATIFAHL